MRFWRALWIRLKRTLGGGRDAPSKEPLTLELGLAGEAAARGYLEQRGLKFLCGNYRSRRGELDLVFRENNQLVFVEVKTRTSERWVRPASAVNASKRRKLSRVALDYLQEIGNPRIPFRFDIVEVLMEDNGSNRVLTIRHWPGAFPLSKPYRYG